MNTRMMSARTRLSRSRIVWEYLKVNKDIEVGSLGGGVDMKSICDVIGGTYANEGSSAWILHFEGYAPLECAISRVN